MAPMTHRTSISSEERYRRRIQVSPALRLPCPQVIHCTLTLDLDGVSRGLLPCPNAVFISQRLAEFYPTLLPIGIRTCTDFFRWAFNTMNHDWKSYDMTDNIQHRPSAGAFSTARDQNRSFWFNGQVDSGSSIQTTNLDSSTSMFQPGMIVINHDDQTARNISTDALVGKRPRTRCRTQWCVGLGSDGILLLIGGNHKSVSDTVDRGVGDLVPMDRVHVFDVSSIYDERVSTEGTWYELPVTGDIPEGRVDFCVMKASAADLSSFNM